MLPIVHKQYITTRIQWILVDLSAFALLSIAKPSYYAQHYASLLDHIVYTHAQYVCLMLITDGAIIKPTRPSLVIYSGKIKPTDKIRFSTQKEDRES